MANVTKALARMPDSAALYAQLASEEAAVKRLRAQLAQSKPCRCAARAAIASRCSRRDRSVRRLRHGAGTRAGKGNPGQNSHTSHPQKSPNAGGLVGFRGNSTAECCVRKPP